MKARMRMALLAPLALAAVVAMALADGIVSSAEAGSPKNSGGSGGGASSLSGTDLGSGRFKKSGSQGGSGLSGTDLGSGRLKKSGSQGGKN
ncbi:hypothetical protein [Methyloligella solikamskensis]|uniref:Uncharacterized protein n=1 Tax=Methyloligella solikamskensis TaxID=1177756 RepID=A0ABW3J9X0_9HYPH